MVSLPGSTAAISVVFTDTIIPGEGLGGQILFVSLFSFTPNYFYADQILPLALVELPKVPTNAAGSTKGRPCVGFGGSLPLEIQPGEIHVKSQPFLQPR